ncbi:MAG: TerD family protein [Clostridium sp.]
MAGILNLQKNDILDLTKKDPSLNNILLGGGWDVAKKGFFSMQADYDLDLVAILLGDNGKLVNSKPLIYFGNQKGTGIYIHGDNRTGAGDGDDEKISISLNSLPKDCAKLVFAVNIYDAKNRRQSFSKVKNAYVRLVNEDKGNAEICRYNLSEDGGDNTAVILAELARVNGDWQFKAVGQLLKASTQDLTNMYR